MQKVKVTRYVSGRRPEYAPHDSESESSDEEDGFLPTAEPPSPPQEGAGQEEVEPVDDRRLRRLRERHATSGSRYNASLVSRAPSFSATQWKTLYN